MKVYKKSILLMIVLLPTSMFGLKKEEDPIGLIESSPKANELYTQNIPIIELRGRKKLGKYGPMLQAKIWLDLKTAILSKFIRDQLEGILDDIANGKKIIIPIPYDQKNLRKVVKLMKHLASQPTPYCQQMAGKAFSPKIAPKGKIKIDIDINKLINQLLIAHFLNIPWGEEVLCARIASILPEVAEKKSKKLHLKLDLLKKGFKNIGFKIGHFFLADPSKPEREILENLKIKYSNEYKLALAEAKKIFIADFIKKKLEVLVPELRNKILAEWGNMNFTFFPISSSDYRNLREWIKGPKTEK